MWPTKESTLEAEDGVSFLCLTYSLTVAKIQLSVSLAQRWKLSGRSSEIVVIGGLPMLWSILTIAILYLMILTLT